MYYINTLKRELVDTNAYKLQPTLSERVIVGGHGCHTALHFGVKAKENQDKVPTLYWLPKLHKKPYISQKSCIPSSIRLWNGLEDDFKNLSTLTTFKKHVISKFNKSYIPSYFTFGNRYISVLHARLRNRCSNLNNDLYINHIRDNPLCDLCGEVEDAINYFFHCRIYTIERQVFNDTVVMLQPLSINLILFGNENWNLETNIVLFRAIQRYIQVTKLFNNI